MAKHKDDKPTAENTDEQIEQAKSARKLKHEELARRRETARSTGVNALFQHRQIAVQEKAQSIARETNEKTNNVGKGIDRLNARQEKKDERDKASQKENIKVFVKSLDTTTRGFDKLLKSLTKVVDQLGKVKKSVDASNTTTISSQIKSSIFKFIMPTVEAKALELGKKWMDSREKRKIAGGELSESKSIKQRLAELGKFVATKAKDTVETAKDLKARPEGLKEAALGLGSKATNAFEAVLKNYSANRDREDRLSSGTVTVAGGIEGVDVQEQGFKNVTSRLDKIVDLLMGGGSIQVTASASGASAVPYGRTAPTPILSEEETPRTSALQRLLHAPVENGFSIPIAQAIANAKTLAVRVLPTPKQDNDAKDKAKADDKKHKSLLERFKELKLTNKQLAAMRGGGGSMFGGLADGAAGAAAWQTTKKLGAKALGYGMKGLKFGGKLLGGLAAGVGGIRGFMNEEENLKKSGLGSGEGAGLTEKILRKTAATAQGAIKGATFGLVDTVKIGKFLGGNGALGEKLYDALHPETPKVITEEMKRKEVMGVASPLTELKRKEDAKRWKETRATALTDSKNIADLTKVTKETYDPNSGIFSKLLGMIGLGGAGRAIDTAVTDTEDWLKRKTGLGVRKSSIEAAIAGDAKALTASLESGEKGYSAYNPKDPSKKKAGVSFGKYQFNSAQTGGGSAVSVLQNYIKRGGAQSDKASKFITLMQGADGGMNTIDKNEMEAFLKASENEGAMIAAQESTADKLYMQPVKESMTKDGIDPEKMKLLTMAMYDTSINSGSGRAQEIYASTVKKIGKPTGKNLREFVKTYNGLRAQLGGEATKRAGKIEDVIAKLTPEQMVANGAEVTGATPVVAEKPKTKEELAAIQVEMQKKFIEDEQVKPVVAEKKKEKKGFSLVSEAHAADLPENLKATGPVSKKDEIKTGYVNPLAIDESGGNRSFLTNAIRRKIDSSIVNANAVEAKKVAAGRKLDANGMAQIEESQLNADLENENIVEDGRLAVVQAQFDAERERNAAVHVAQDVAPPVLPVNQIPNVTSNPVIEQARIVPTTPEQVMTEDRLTNPEKTEKENKAKNWSLFGNITDIGSAIKDKAQAVGSSVKGVYDDATAPGAVSGLWDKVVGGAKSVKNAAVDTYHEVKGDVSEIGSRVKTAAVDDFNGIGSMYSAKPVYAEAQTGSPSVQAQNAALETARAKQATTVVERAAIEPPAKKEVQEKKTENAPIIARASTGGSTPKAPSLMDGDGSFNIPDFGLWMFTNGGFSSFG